MPFSLKTSEWSATQLWKAISAKKTEEAVSIRNELGIFMPRIQTILRSAGTAPTNFTLHDAEHSFRVAERIVEITPSETLRALTIYELTLLLLSAYLHDIGMSPEQKNVNSHYEYLLTANAGLLSVAQTQKFQQFLDDSKYRLVPPLNRGTLDPNDLRLAREVTAAYCRERHNDWSEDWIRKHLAGMKLGTYAGAAHDLVALCRSHHEGYIELASEAFNARFVGANALVVNLRYLAVLLRIADVLEFDPERTPDVILRHREIPADSLVYWYKDHELSLRIDENRVVLSARPSSASLEHAIRQMISQIDDELSLCRRLADEKHFEVCPGLSKTTKHAWHLSPRSHPHIEKRGSYEYIDGAFRPDTNKLLELLSGVELYGSPLEAVRELVQNAFDSVRVKMAYARLMQANPNDPEFLKSLTTLQKVDIRLDMTTEGPCLTCEDTGVGMTKNIISNRFLISGSGKKHELLSLERRTEMAGFRVASTGQFGIGVLSYFMICDRLQITTRRAAHADDDHESSGWAFLIDGVSSFGELRRTPNTPEGTSVQLFVKNHLLQPDLTVFFRSIRDYLVKRLQWLPCKFSFSSTVSGCEPLHLQSGWGERDKVHREWILDQCGPEEADDVPLLDIETRNQKAAEEAHWIQIRKEVSDALGWRIEEGELPEGLGIYRIALPYFKVLNQLLLGFLSARNAVTGGIELGRVGKGTCLKPEGRTLVSWRGFIPMRAIKAGYPMLTWEQGVGGFGNRVAVPWEGGSSSPRSVFCDINLESNDSGVISVNRQQLSLSQKTKAAFSFVSGRINNLEAQIVSASKGSEFETINARLSKAQGTFDETRIVWPIPAENNEGDDRISEQTFPIMLCAKRLPPHEQYRINQKILSAVPAVTLHSRENYSATSISCLDASSTPDKIVIYPKFTQTLNLEFTRRFPRTLLAQRSYLLNSNPFDEGTIPYREQLWAFRVLLSPVWVTPDAMARPKNSWGIMTTFPPEWRHICGAHFENYFGTKSALYWNENNPVVRRVDAQDFFWVSNRFSDKTNPLSFKAEILSNASIAAAWVLNSIKNSAYSIWDALKDNDPNFLTSVWELLFGDGSIGAEVCQWYQGSDTKLRVLTPNGWHALRNVPKEQEQVHRLLPVSSSEWRVSLDSGDSEPLSE
jgi:hypothetical protein